MTGPTLDEIRKWPATVGIADACRALGISKSWGHQLAAQDEFPCKVIKVNHRVRVITASLIALLECR